MNQSLLKIKGLKTHFRLKGDKLLRAVDGIDLDIRSSEIHGLVGESGCGKTVTALSILRLVNRPGYIAQGQIWWNGNDLLALSDSDIRHVRGKEIAMIFQNPQAALNPLYPIGEQLKAVLRLHRRLDRREAEAEALRMLKIVKIPDPAKNFHDYAHQLSGGMCQRVMIAIALSCRPQLLIADEPTAALDVTIQAQILDLLLELREEFQTAMLLISHDMGVVARMCDRISVMYLGKIIESATAEQLYATPKHPYTQALLQAVPIPDPARRSRLSLVNGDLPSSIEVPVGCRFRTRCPHAFDKCQAEEPPLRPLTKNGTQVACWLYDYPTH